MPPAPPPFLPTSALALQLDAYVAVTAAIHAGIADSRAHFECTFPRFPGGDGFLVLAGLEPLLDALERFRVKSDELTWLESVGAIDGQARSRLAEMRFACDVDASLEGTLLFAGEPALTVEGPYWQAQLVADFVRGALGYATLAATRAARAVLAADGCEVIESSAATAHRLGGNPLVARAAYVGGAHSTTSALAARRYKIPVRATLPSRVTLGAPSAAHAYQSWLTASPERAILRVDHRDFPRSLAAVVAAVKARAEVSSWHEAEIAIELSGGDLVGLAHAAVQAFQAAGLAAPLVVARVADAASADMVPHVIADVRQRGAPVGAFLLPELGVDDGSFLPRYDVVAIESVGQWSPRVRLGDDVASTTTPGRKQVVRYLDATGSPLGDVSCASNERFPPANDVRYVDARSGFPARLEAASSVQLSANVMRAGKRVAAPESAQDARERTLRSLAALPERYRRLHGAAAYPVGLTTTLAALKTELIAAR